LLLSEAKSTSWLQRAASSFQSYLHPTSSPEKGCDQFQANYTENGAGVNSSMGNKAVDDRRKGLHVEATTKQRQSQGTRRLSRS